MTTPPKLSGKPWRRLTSNERGLLPRTGPKTPEVSEQVRRMAAEGTKKAAIARVCKVSRQTVYTILAGE